MGVADKDGRFDRGGIRIEKRIKRVIIESFLHGDVVSQVFA